MSSYIPKVFLISSEHAQGTQCVNRHTISHIHSLNHNALRYTRTHTHSTPHMYTLHTAYTPPQQSSKDKPHTYHP